MTGTYTDSWAQAQAAGTAIAYPGNTAGNTRNSRIDYIYYSRGASSLVLKSSQVYDARDAHGVMPSDHRPLLSVFTVK
jgi:exonuclease III